MSQIHVVEQIQSQWHPKCAICEEFVAIEESKTNDHGLAVHERCYVSSLIEIRRSEGLPDAPRYRRVVTCGNRRLHWRFGTFLPVLFHPLLQSL